MHDSASIFGTLETTVDSEAVEALATSAAASSDPPPQLHPRRERSQRPLARPLNLLDLTKGTKDQKETPRERSRSREKDNMEGPNDMAALFKLVSGQCHDMAEMKASTARIERDMKQTMKTVAQEVFTGNLQPIQAEMKAFREELARVKTSSAGGTVESGVSTRANGGGRPVGKADPQFPRYLVVKGWVDWSTKETQMATKGLEKSWSLQSNICVIFCV